jgi:hypothetical protein
VASYQVPQFIDSGDKIFLGLNVRQFAYAMAGMFFAFLVFTVTTSLVKGIGNFALIPCIPFVALFGYLAWGKFNGRDSEVYVLKYFLFTTKPKIMVFRRTPDISEIPMVLSTLSEATLTKEMESRAATKLSDENNQYSNFNLQDSASKAKRIRNLTTLVDDSLTNSLSQVQRSQLDISQKEQLLQQVQNQRGNNAPTRFIQNQVLSRNPLSDLDIPNPLASNQQKPAQNRTSQQQTQAQQNPAVSPFDDDYSDDNVVNQNDQNFFQ